jgi:hypothetical protein
MSAKAIRALKSREWTMGNGQCELCQGLSPAWYEKGQNWDANEIGHKQNCPIALSLQAMGESPVMLGEYSPGLEAPVLPVRAYMETDILRVMLSPEYARMLTKHGLSLPTESEIKKQREVVALTLKAIDSQNG